MQQRWVRARAVETGARALGVLSVGQGTTAVSLASMADLARLGRVGAVAGGSTSGALCVWSVDNVLTALGGRLPKPLCEGG